MERQVQRAVALLLDGYVVDVLEATQPVGRGVHPLDQVRLLRLALDRQEKVKVRQLLGDSPLDLVRQRLGAFDRKRAPGGDAGVREQPAARTPDPDRADLADAMDLADGLAKPGLDARRSPVHELVAGLAEDPDGGDPDQASPGIAEPDRDQPHQYPE